MTTYLEVPFEEKDDAKSLGARWDPAAKSWFVPDGLALEPFADWLPDGHPIRTEPGWLRVARQTGRSPHVLLLLNQCWRCDQRHYAVSLALHVPEHEMPRHDPYSYKLRLGGKWDCFFETGGAVGEYEWVLKQLANFIESTPAFRGRVATFKERFSRTTGRAYLSQGCPYCDSLWGDFPLEELEADEYGAQVLMQDYDAERLVFAFELRLP